MPNPIDLDRELDDAMLSGGQTPADVQAALDAELSSELSPEPNPTPAATPTPADPIRRSVAEKPAKKRKPTRQGGAPAPAPTPTPAAPDRPTMNVHVEYVRSESTKMLNARIDEDLMTHLSLVSAVNKARKTGLPTVRSIIEQALVEWFERNAPLPGRDQLSDAA